MNSYFINFIFIFCSKYLGILFLMFFNISNLDAVINKLICIFFFFDWSKDKNFSQII